MSEIEIIDITQVDSFDRTDTDWHRLIWYMVGWFTEEDAEHGGRLIDDESVHTAMRFAKSLAFTGLTAPCCACAWNGAISLEWKQDANDGVGLDLTIEGESIKCTVWKGEEATRVTGWSDCERAVFENAVPYEWEDGDD